MGLKDPVTVHGCCRTTETMKHPIICTSSMTNKWKLLQTVHVQWSYQETADLNGMMWEGRRFWQGDMGGWRPGGLNWKYTLQEMTNDKNMLFYQEICYVEPSIVDFVWEQPYYEDLQAWVICLCSCVSISFCSPASWSLHVSVGFRSRWLQAPLHFYLAPSIPLASISILHCPLLFQLEIPTPFPFLFIFYHNFQFIYFSGGEH